MAFQNVPKPRFLNEPPQHKYQPKRPRRLREKLAADKSETVRLNRMLADLGVSSRRGADKLIEAGRVKVNGELAELGQQVSLDDTIELDNKKLRMSEQKNYLYLLLYKPTGVTCTTDKRRRDNIISYLNYPERLFPVGRLDRDSEGLILLTNDGAIVNKMLRVENEHEKEYEVTLNKPYDTDFVKQMQNGVPILDTVTLPTKIKPLGGTRFRIVLRQGLNRQIRRMCEALGYKVVRLKRVRIMHLAIGRMRPGDARFLSAKEEAELLRLTAGDKG